MSVISVISVALKTAQTVENIVNQIPGATVNKWIHEDDSETLCIIDENNCSYKIKVTLPETKQ